MVRKGNWKLIYNVEAPHQLFDLSIDPEKLNNQFVSNEQIVKELIGALADICNPETVIQQAEAFWQKQVAHWGDLETWFYSGTLL